MDIRSIVVALLNLFLLSLLARLILDYVQMLARNFRPKGIALYFVEAIYTITDQPMRFVRQYIPPVRIGAVSIDMSFIVIFFGVNLLIGLIS
ncbi:unannotated protein [freshwater metagenome]|uniref:Unannotated protein n=1 Tax=freshwater metagenome TaxID=449393 RepID=A0A6J7I6D4_9ZZZZ|nr:YggT family protein [Actinomycetota bacterium]